MSNKLLAELKNNRTQLILLFIYTAFVVFFCSKMSPFYPIQEWSDINLYFNIGKAIMNGQTLYTESFDPKGPLIFFTYGVGYLISNNDFLGMFIIQILVWFVLVSAAYFTARLYVSKMYSFIVSIFFLLIFLSHTMQGGAVEEFITAYMAVSLYLFIRYFRNPHKHKISHMYIHGLMWGLALFTKFNLVVFWVFPLIAVGLILLFQKEYKNLIQNILAFIAGGITIAIPIAIYFISKGVLGEAIDVYFILNSSFRVETTSAIVSKVATSFYQRMRFETIEFGIILLGAFIFPLLNLKNNISRVSIPLAFLSVFTIVFMAGYVYYYSIPYYLFAMLGCIVIASITSKYVKLKDSLLIAAIALLIGLSGSIYRKGFFGKYENTDSNEAKNVIEKFTPIILNEKDRSLVNLGFDDANGLFTYAHIMPNTKYFTAPNLPHEVYPELRDQQTRYIEEGKTMFVVLAEYTNNALYFSQLDALQENYEVVEKFGEYYEWHNVNRFYYLYKRKDNNK